jgi:hypothetical protein
MKSWFIVILLVVFIAMVMSSCSLYTCATYAKAPQKNAEKNIRL